MKFVVRIRSIAIFQTVNTFNIEFIPNPFPRIDQNEILPRRTQSTHPWQYLHVYRIILHVRMRLLGRINTSNFPKNVELFIPHPNVRIRSIDALSRRLHSLRLFALVNNWTVWPVSRWRNTSKMISAVRLFVKYSKGRQTAKSRKSCGLVPVE